MFNGRSHLNVVQASAEPSLLELCRQPTFKEFKCLVSECKVKSFELCRAQTTFKKNLNFVQTKIEPKLPGYIECDRNSKNLNVLQVRAESSSFELYRSAAEILQRKSYLRRKLRYNNRKDIPLTS